ncbi:MAG TPA: 1-acyl-sn-glycerol-3-phosphate acyltransferase [Cyclobacteriaceae bacterium]|nr:1-acyl-sn-glycerol-3-phosphate acyltransferase [Cyclobacteriaceae bacterium]
MSTRTETGSEKIAPDLPPEVPSFGNHFTRWIGRVGLRLLGWKVVGDFPAEKKFLIALAPHTSNWDFVTAIFALLAIGIKLSWLMKKEAFIWPFAKLFIALGGIPINRGAAEDTVRQIHDWYENHEKVCVAITPEGTRAKVAKWKTGFLRIVRHAGVPLFLVAWDYPSKRIVLDRCWDITSDNLVEESEKIRAYINSRFTGKHPENQ